MAETQGATERIEHTVRVAAPPETVFEYFTDPTKLVRWMGSEAMLDPRPGGVCRFDINGSKMIGEYVQVVVLDVATLDVRVLFEPMVRRTQTWLSG